MGLGYTADTGPTLPHQIVAAIISDSFYFGQLGLGFQPTNQSGFGNPQASFSDTLWSNGTISSQSWSYTAGAFYRLKGVFGSLVFGGYDVARFVPNVLRFSMTGDNLRDIVVTVRSITSTTAAGNTTLMGSPEFAFIDSTLPELYLPAAVCTEFEKAFGLTLDKPSGLYLINTTQHQNLLTLNPNITLTLANQKTGGETLDFVLPYAAFDLNVTSPILVNKTSKYFPLKQAPDGAYALGRVFLQEVGVVAHYNSRTFQVLQSKFEDSPETNIVALPPTLPTPSTPSSTTSPSGTNSNGSKKGLGKGAIAGIVVGALALLTLAGLLAFFLLRRKRRQSLEGKRPGTPIAEIDTGKRLDNPDQSAYVGQASRYTSEVPGQSAKVEIQGNPIMHPQELEAEPVPDRDTNGRAEMGNGFVTHGRGGRTPMAELGEDELFLGPMRRNGESGTGTGEGFSPISAPGLSSTSGSGRNKVSDGEVSEMGDESSPNSTNAHARGVSGGYGGGNRDTMVSMMTPVEGPSATGGFGPNRGSGGGHRVSGMGGGGGGDERGIGGRGGGGERWSPVTDTSPTDSTNLERRKSRFEERFGED